MPHHIMTFKEFGKELGHDFKPLRKPVNSIITAIEHDFSNVSQGVGNILKRGGGLLDTFSNPVVIVGILLVGGIVLLKK